MVAMVMVVGIIAPPLSNIAYAASPSSASAIWLDGTSGDDSNNGSKEKPVKTFAKAMEIINDGETLNVGSLAETNITVNKKVTLKFLEDVTMQGTGTAITLKGGAHLCVAEGKTLNINGYNKGILVEKGAEINDGNYVFKFPNNGFAFETSGNIVGSSKDKLTIDITNGYFMFHSKDNELRNATINQRYDDDKWQLYEWNGFKAFNSEINLYRLPVYLKGPLYLDNTKFVIDGTGVDYQTGAYFENSWGVGEFHFTNNSIFEVKNFNTHWRSKGITFGYGNRVLVDNEAKIVVKNNGNGGFNDNQGIATFNGGYLEGEGHSGSLFGAQDKADTKIVFGADSVVNTPMAKQSDNGLGQSGTNYIVLGGSHRVFYDPSYYSGLAIPVNGDDNGNEKLTLFKLANPSVDKLNPINKSGKPYEYSVKNASDDGNKYVWTPAAKVTFKLNNGNASFADGSKEAKVQKTIRGYKLDDVAGNDSLKDPADSKGVKFSGWFYKTDSGEEKPFNRAEALTADLDVYAKWERKTVIYHNGAGKDYISSAGEDAQNIEVLSFEDIVKEKADFNVEGKKFVGWTTAPDGNGKVYSAKEKINFTEGQSQIDLYAKYTDNEYKVSFSANGGTFSKNSIFKTKTDVFTIEKDVNGGEVAVLNKRAKYNDKLFDLLNGLDHNELKPDKDAKKTGFVISNPDYFSDRAEAGGKAIRFDDYTIKFFGRPRTVKGKNPEITSDTTYYLSWKDDPNVPTISSPNETLKADVWGQDRVSSPKVQIVTPGEAFSLTGEIDAASIKGKMQEIETVFNKHTDAEFSSIALSNVSSTFKATLTMPDDVVIPKNPTVTAKGLGNCFDLGKAEVKGQKVTIPFTLKPGMTDYKKLKGAVFSTGQVSEDGTNNSLISVQIDGLKLKDTVANGQKVTVTGSVDGTFSALARDDATLNRFSFTWKGKQTPEGKDEAATNEGIQYTLMMSKPTEFTLPGDLLVKKAEKNYDTTHQAVYPIDESDTLTFKGQLDVSPIKNQINLLANGQSSTDKIDLEKVKSGFVAKIEIPQGLEIPDAVQATLTENDLFKVTDVSKAGNVITVRMDLKKSYTKFDDLKKDVNAAGGDESKLNVEIPGIIVKDNTSGKEFVAKGQVEGNFFGIARKEKTTRVFNFAWKAQQTPEGKDVRQGQDDNNTIQLTLALPEQFDLPGDILIGEDTEHDALHKVKPGELLEFTGRLDVTSIKDKINLLKLNYGQDTSNIKTDNVKSTFIAKLEIPEGLEIPGTPTATLTNNDLFEIKNGDVYKDGNQIVVKMTLKKAYSKFDNLWKDVNAVPNTLDLKVPGIKVKDSLVDGTKKTVLGHVEGKFEGTATSDSGKMQNYHFKWIGKQTPDGRDFILKGTDSESIQYTVVVKRESKPIPDPTPSTPSTPSRTIIPIKPSDTKLNLVDHLAYMKGYPDLTFGPDRNMTRAEVTMMFARLLKDRPEANKVYAMPYSDVTKADWYAYAVSYMTENKLIMGYPDGTFKPNSPISRAEFAAIASRFDQLKTGLSLPFNDVGADHWAYDVIASAADKGWVNGYPDGSFKPENKITRAEVVSTTNRMLNRYADLAFAKSHKTELAPMRDMDESHWAYGAAVEAMNGHDYHRQADGKNETWILLNGKRFTFPIAPSGIAN